MIEIPSLDKWDVVLKKLRDEAKKKNLSEKDIDEMVAEARAVD